METPFKYQFPLRHITLNELPSELFPLPMRNSTKVSGTQLMETNPSFQILNLSDKEDRERRKYYTEHHSSTVHPYRRPSLYLNGGFRIRSEKKRFGTLSPKSRIASKTEQLCRMQTESSQEAKEMLRNGNSISINFHDNSILIQPEQPLPFLNDQTNRYINETSTFQRKRENIRDKLREKLFYYYRQAVNQNSPHKDYLMSQMQRYREFVILPPEDELSEDQKKALIIENNRKQALKLARKNQPPKDHQRAKSVYHPNQALLKRARELKTEEHHRLIARLNIKTHNLIQQWTVFNNEEAAKETRVKPPAIAQYIRTHYGQL